MKDNLPDLSHLDVQRSKPAVFKLELKTPQLTTLWLKDDQFEIVSYICNSATINMTKSVGLRMSTLKTQELTFWELIFWEEHTKT